MSGQLWSIPWVLPRKSWQREERAHPHKVPVSCAPSPSDSPSYGKTELPVTRIIGSANRLSSVSIGSWSIDNRRQYYSSTHCGLLYHPTSLLPTTLPLSSLPPHLSPPYHSTAPHHHAALLPTTPPLYSPPTHITAPYHPTSLLPTTPPLFSLPPHLSSPYHPISLLPTTPPLSSLPPHISPPQHPTSLFPTTPLLPTTIHPSSLLPHLSPSYHPTSLKYPAILIILCINQSSRIPDRRHTPWQVYVSRLLEYSPHLDRVNAVKLNDTLHLSIDWKPADSPAGISLCSIIFLSITFMKRDVLEHLSSQSATDNYQFSADH